MKTNIRIGLFGYGCVGSGLYDIISKLPSFEASILKIAIKDKNKPRNLHKDIFTFNKFDILHNTEINVVVELIDDADEAFEIVAEALRNKKAVVTANKKMLAEHFQTLHQLAKENNVPLLYEAAVAGAIPIIRTLEEYYNNYSLTSIEGILNGTTNYILSATNNNKLNYKQALKEAQDLGFAESNPKLDVEAFDPKYKLSILVAHAFGILLKPEQFLNSGIQNLSETDIKFAAEKEFTLKLIAHASVLNNSLSVFVIPRFISLNNTFCSVNNSFNTVEVAASFSDKQIFTGKGAGSHPTGAAVLSDISALKFDYRYELKKLENQNQACLNNEQEITIYLRYTHNSIFEELKFSTVEAEFVSQNHKYIIGKISLQKLIDLNPNQRKDLFIAQVDSEINKKYTAVNQ